jgi:hypothetical protein
MGRHKRPNMVAITRNIHRNAKERIDNYIEKENLKELKKESKNEKI